MDLVHTPVADRLLASSRRAQTGCPCYSLRRFAGTFTLHYVMMRIARLEGECPHEPWLRGSLNKVNAVNRGKIRVPSPKSGVKIESFDSFDSFGSSLAQAHRATKPDPALGAPRQPATTHQQRRFAEKPALPCPACRAEPCLAAIVLSNAFVLIFKLV
jgi:hypothetical protein